VISSIIDEETQKIWSCISWCLPRKRFLCVANRKVRYKYIYV
jgi:hypothetical protein